MTEFWAHNQDLILRLVVAVVLGLIVGAERVLVHKDAGMKTHALVSLGSAVFVIISEMMTATYANLPGVNPTMIIGQIVVGIGFLGAGSIMLYENRLRGLTTAGGLWVMAGIGMAAGLGLFALSIMITLLVLFVLIVVNIFENPIRRISRESDTAN